LTPTTPQSQSSTEGTKRKKDTPWYVIVDDEECNNATRGGDEKSQHTMEMVVYIRSDGPIVTSESTINLL
jgi:hypothetical protein